MSSSFATPADFLTRYDSRVLAQLATDNSVTKSPTQIVSDDVLQACLDDAAGDIVAACVVGNRYTEGDLNALTGASLAHLKRINCDLAMRYLADRRVYHKLNETLERITERADKVLRELREGTQLFNIEAKVVASEPQVSGPTTATLENLYTIRRRTQHYYPTEVLPGNR